MKLKYISLALVLSLLATQVVAQIIYPVTVFVVWDKNLDSDQVIDYTLIHNNGSQNTTSVITNASCTGSLSEGQCRQGVVVPGAGAQTVTLTSRNQWGSSEPTSVTFTVTAPGKSRNIKITK